MKTEDALCCWLKSPETLLEHREEYYGVGVGVDWGVEERVDLRDQSFPRMN